MHPGGEHWPDSDDHKGWNADLHRRKFLVSPGRYIAEGEQRKGEIVFWGEWEPQSRVVERFDPRVPDGPHFLYEPYYQPPASWDGVWLQNTDPFVFGAQFHYTGCLQHTRRGPTQLRYLERGSIALFGSCRERQRFVIDTVFVVDRWIDHNARDYRQQLDGAVSDAYAEVTIAPWYSGAPPESQSHRLYFGATPENPVGGLFSFFPCLPTEAAPQGFARPAITLPNLITPHLTQGKKMTTIADDEHARELWSEVASQVEEQGLALAIEAKLPEKLGTLQAQQRTAGACS